MIVGELKKDIGALLHSILDECNEIQSNLERSRIPTKHMPLTIYKFNVGS